MAGRELTEKQKALCWDNIREATYRYVNNDVYNGTEGQEFAKKLDPNLDAIESHVVATNGVLV